MAFKIDGVDVAKPDPPAAAINEISRAYEDISGVMHMKHIRRKRTTDWTYSALSDADWQHIQDLVQAQYDKGNEYCMVTSPSPGKGPNYTALMYLGSPTKFQALQCYEDGVPYWQVTISWIEVIGTKLNKDNSQIPE